MASLRGRTDNLTVSSQMSVMAQKCRAGLASCVADHVLMWQWWRLIGGGEPEVLDVVGFAGVTYIRVLYWAECCCL
jgi:hypothetical protein